MSPPARRTRVLVLTSDAGLGHRSAARAVRDALVERYASRVLVSVAHPLDDPRTPRWLRDSQSSYDRVAREAPELYRAGYDLSDGKALSRMVENAMRALLFRSIRDCLDRARPHVVVSTYPLYAAPLGAVFAAGQAPVPLVNVVTDLASVHRIWFSPVPDLTVVATSLVRDNAVRAGLDPRKVAVLGIPVNPVFSTRAPSRASLRRELGWRPGLTTLLAVSSPRTGRMTEYLDVLNHSGHALQVCLITGGDEELRRTATRMVWHIPAHIHGRVANLPNLMRASDLVLCKPGGLIVSESLAAGVPLLLLDPIPGQEEGNARYVVDAGAGERAGDALGFLRTICHWLENGKAVLQTRARHARAAGRPRAAHDLAVRIWSLGTERG